MKLASRTEPMAPLKVPYSYINNPRIMKIVKDSYGNLNEKFNPVQVQFQAEINCPTPSFDNCHFVISGNKFVPVSMDVSSTQSQMGQKFQLKTPTSSHTSQSMLPRVKNNNPAKFMPLPIPVQNGEHKYENTFQSSCPSSWMSKNNEPNKRKNEGFGDKENKRKDYQAKTIFCTGTIERLIKWNRTIEDVFCIYETIAPIVSLQEGRIKNQKIMLLRDKKGPILQVQYYTNTHIDINDFAIGQYLRCVGRMIGFNILSAESIRGATESEISTLARLSYVCDYSVTHNLRTD